MERPATNAHMLVGRDQELELLEGQLSSVKKGHGRLVFLSGEAGIGKATLINFLMEKHKGDVTFLNYACSRGKKRPYEPFLTLLEESIGAEIGPLGKKGVKEALHELKQAAKERGRGDLKKSKDRLFMTVTDGFMSASTDIPLVMFIDNLQWADKDSLGLLHHLAKSTRKSKVMIIGAYRPEEMDEAGEEIPPLMEVMSEMVMEELFQNVPLERLDRANTGLLVRHILGREDISEEFVDLVFQDTNGNPFFISEVINSLLNEGSIDPTDKDWPLKLDLASIKFPKSIKDAIFERLAKLPRETREVLDAASVLGLLFDVKDLAKLTERDEGELVQVLYSLTENKIVVPDFKVEGSYRFDHTKIQELVESELGNKTQALHGRAGKILEEANASSLEKVAYDLAFHFSKANDRGKALRYSEMAARKATEENAPVEAKRYWVFALESVGAIADKKERRDKEGAILISLGDTEDIIGEWETALERYGEVIKLARKSDNSKQLAGAYRRIGHIWREKSEWDKAKHNYEQGLEIAKDTDDLNSLADIYRGLGKINWRRGNYPEAEKYTLESIECAKKAGDSTLMGVAGIELGNLYGDTGHYSKAITTYEKSIKELEKNNVLAEISRAYNNMGEQYKYMGNIDRAIECYEQCISNSKKCGEVRTMGYGLLNAAECYAKVGDLGRAQDYADRSMRIFQKLEEKYVISGVYMVYGLIHGLNKRWDEAEENFERSIGMLDKLGVKYDLAVTSAEFGRMLIRKGDLKKAEGELKRALEIFDSLKSEKQAERVKQDLRRIVG